MQLPNVAHDDPAAVLLIDTDSHHVVYVNALARQLAPDVTLPLDVEEWSKAAGLQVAAGGSSITSTAPLSHVAAGDPGTGRQVSAALHFQQGPQATSTQEALWAIGMPLRDAPAPLRARSLLVLMPLRFPDSDVRAAGTGTTTDTGTGTGTGTIRAHPSVLASGLALAISDPTQPDNPVIWVSPSFEQLTGYTSPEVVGRNCRFLQGPDTDPTAVTRLREGIAAQETVGVTLLNYRHDGSAFHNHLLISPVFDAEGVLTHHVSVQTDVTQQVLTARDRDIARAAGERARAAQVAAEEAEHFGRLLLTLSEALAAAITVDDVAKTVTDVVAAELGAAGGGLMLADAARTRLDYVSMAAMPPGTDAAWSRIDWNEDAPPALAARTRQAIFHRDDTAMSAGHPGLDSHAAVPRMGATVNLPLIAGGEVIGAVFLYWEQAQDLPVPQQAALEALARYTAQAVQRASLLAQRRTAAEVLQRSLLTRLPEPDHLELRARYVPAAAGEHVGGDWYDAVVLPDGATTVVIGDVTGHDITAAAQMGQLRGLLRAFAFDRDDPPAQIVTRLDRAVEGLHVNTLATLVLARIEQDEELEAAGLRRFRWTNAGHPPPILLHPDGSTQVLDSAPEMLVGLVPEARRSDHVHLLPPDCTLLLYTDGLIEHRGRTLDEGIADLRRVLSHCAGATVQDLLDHLVSELVGDSPDDDCAILAVRAHPEDRPRPTEAGPNRLT